MNIGDVTFMQRGVSALMIACSKGHNAIVQLLLNNASVNHQTLVCLMTSTHIAHIFALNFFSIFVFALCNFVFSAYVLMEWRNSSKVVSPEELYGLMSTDIIFLQVSNIIML